MSGFPVRPKGEDEHAWYRRIEQDLALSIISADPKDSVCDGCGQKRVIYQAQIYPERTIMARCKDCFLARAGEPERLWVRTEAGLRRTWQRDGRDRTRTAAARASLLARHNGGTWRS
jgi:hypothetical protein